ncbi:MAG: TetR/AcrR family transcriptional regulator [Verrucomicrobiales bacterium]
MGRVSNAKERLMEAVGELIWTGSYGATTIDQICEKAGVKKGSFYYFFESKAELAQIAIETEWKVKRAELDAIFSPTVPPLERLQNYCNFALKWQSELQCKCGCVLGCPLFSLGSEISTQEEGLRETIKAIFDLKRKYLETAIRDAAAQGLVNVSDPASKARMLFSYYEGLLTEARIQNDLDLLKEMYKGTSEMLGLPQSLKSSAAAGE